MLILTAYTFVVKHRFYPFITLFGWIKPRLVSLFASLRYLRSLAILRALEVSP